VTESQLVNQICEGLLYRGIFCWRSNNIPIFSQKQNCFRKLPKFTPRGVADITGILPNGQFFCVEVKSEKGKQSEFQKIFQEKIEATKGIYILAKSFEEVDKIISEMVKNIKNNSATFSQSSSVKNLRCLTSEKNNFKNKKRA